MKRKTDCLTCMNFKTRIINETAIERGKNPKDHLYNFYQFPINAVVLRNLKIHCDCQIYYCRLNMMVREVYVVHGGNVSYNPLGEFCVGYDKCDKLDKIQKGGEKWIKKAY